MRLALRTGRSRLANRTEDRTCALGVTTFRTRQLRDQIARKIERCAFAELFLRAGEQITELRFAPDAETQQRSEILVPSTVGATRIFDPARLAPETVDVQPLARER